MSMRTQNTIYGMHVIITEKIILLLPLPLRCFRLTKHFIPSGILMTCHFARISFLYPYATYKSMPPLSPQIT